MAYVVGSKGQVVIAKEIRDRLGVEPGWTTLQRLVGDHVEVYFLPPERRRSLKGTLAPQLKARVAPGDEWEQARDTAWKSAAGRRVRGGARSP